MNDPRATTPPTAAGGTEPPAGASAPPPAPPGGPSAPPGSPSAPPAGARAGRGWRGGLLALAAGHGILAAVAWVRSTGSGAHVPDVVGGAYAVLVTLVAAAVAAALPSRWLHRRGARAGALAAALLLPLQAYLVQRSFRPTVRYEDAVTTGEQRSDDGRFGFALELCEPLTPLQFAQLNVKRKEDGRAWRVPVPLRRTERDAFSTSIPWARLSALGEERYWLAVSGAVARPGPQFFVVETGADPPRVSAVEKGLSRVDGRARWDCAAWPPAAAPSRTAPAAAAARAGPGPDAGPNAAPDAGPDAAPDAGPDAAPNAAPDAAPDVIESICGPSGILPPERACLLDGLAAACGPDVARVAARCPAFVADAPVAAACLERRVRDGDVEATDARLAVRIVERDGNAAARLIEDAHAAEAPRDAACAAARHAGRRLAAGRGIPHQALWLRGAEDLLALRAKGNPAACPAGPLPGEELRRTDARLLWEIATIRRGWGDLAGSCARLESLVAGPGLSALEPDARPLADEWLQVCASLDRP